MLVVFILRRVAVPVVHVHVWAETFCIRRQIPIHTLLIPSGVRGSLPVAVIVRCREGSRPQKFVPCMCPSFLRPRDALYLLYVVAVALDAARSFSRRQITYDE